MWYSKVPPLGSSYHRNNLICFLCNENILHHNRVCISWHKNIEICTVVQETKTAFTRCRHILKTMKNVTVAKFELAAFTRCRNNLKTVRNLPVKSSLQDFDAN